MKARESQWRESPSEMDVTIVGNIITEMTSHHLCSIVLVQNKVQVPPTLKGRGLPRGVNISDNWGPL